MDKGEWKKFVHPPHKDILAEIKETRPHVDFERNLSFDPACTTPLEKTQTLDQQKISHGSEIYRKVDTSSAATNTGPGAAGASGDDNNNDGNDNGNSDPKHRIRVIKPDGSI